MKCVMNKPQTGEKEHKREPEGHYVMATPCQNKGRGQPGCGKQWFAENFETVDARKVPPRYRPNPGISKNAHVCCRNTSVCINLTSTHVGSILGRIHPRLSANRSINGNGAR